MRCFALLLIATPALAQDPVIPRFADETATAGLTTPYLGDWEFMVGGGVATFDCTGDGRPEVFLPGGSGPSGLFRNDSTAETLAFSPLELAIDNATGAYPLDIDSDGLTDLAVLRVGPDMLLRGTGDCAFEPAPAAWNFDGGDDWTAAFAATWEDGQTFPTLAFGSYIDRTEDLFPWGSCTPNRLFRPDGDGYAAPIPLTPSHCALSLLFTDWDRSGTPALRVSNDREYYKGGEEQLWRLSPGADPVLFTAAEGWARLRIWGMGIAARDITGDGRMDYFLTSMADNRLQILRDSATGPVYDDAAFARGVTAHRPYTGDEVRPSTAWHAQFEDLNADGLADLFIVKGNVAEMPDFAQADPNNLLLQRLDGTFLEAGDESGLASVGIGRGGAVVDLNLDGILDVVVQNRWTGPEVWRALGPVGAAVQVRLEQPGANRDGIGAFISWRSAAGVQTREITVGGGHAGGQLGWWHLGLGALDMAEVQVTWPDGTVGPWQTIPAGGFAILRPGQEPEGWTPPG